MKKILLLLLFWCGFFSYATVTPTPLKDKRIQVVNYDPNDVVRFTVQVGKAAVIEFDPSEKILFANNGNAESWELAKKENMLYLGAKTSGANTNLIVQTDQRQYFIDLIPTTRQGAYKLKFTYNENNITPNYGLKNKILNFSYYGYGNKELAPILAYDDGIFTYFKFKPSLDSPIIYKVTADGREAIVGFRIENDLVVVHELSSRFNIRLGKKVLGIVNRGKLNNAYNKSRTSESGARKVKK